MNPIFAAAMRRRFAGAGGLESALSNLSTSLMINGATKTPTLYALGQTATPTLWTPAVGDALTPYGAGVDPTTGLDVPTISSSDKSVKFATGEDFYSVASTSFAELGTDDFVLEAVCMRTNISGRYYILQSRTATGIDFRVDGGTLGVILSGAGGLGILTTANAFANNAWYHVMAFGDASGTMSSYINGVFGSSSGSIAGVGSVTNGTALRVGANWPGRIAQVAIWQGASWLDTSLQATVAAERAKALFGANTDETRDSLAYLHKPVSGAKKYFLVGKNWMRLSQDVGGSPAYQKEAAATNTCDNSWDVTGSGWGVLEGSLAIGTTVAPDGTLAGAFSENGTSNPHRVQITGMNASTVETNVLSFFVKKENRGLIVAWLSAGTTSSHAYFDLDAVTTHNNDGGLTWSIVDVGDDWRKISVPFSSSASNITAYLYSSGTTGPWSGGISVAGGSNEAYSIWGLQCEVGTVPSSPIKTTAGQATRLADA